MSRTVLNLEEKARRRTTRLLQTEKDAAKRLAPLSAMIQSLHDDGYIVTMQSLRRLLQCEPPFLTTCLNKLVSIQAVKRNSYKFVPGKGSSGGASQITFSPTYSAEHELPGRAVAEATESNRKRYAIFNIDTLRQNRSGICFGGTITPTMRAMVAMLKKTKHAMDINMLTDELMVTIGNTRKAAKRLATGGYIYAFQWRDPRASQSSAKWCYTAHEDIAAKHLDDIGQLRKLPSVSKQPDFPSARTLAAHPLNQFTTLHYPRMEA